MDMMPPQTPPAIVRSSRQDVADALARIGAMQAWLTEQGHAMPLPAPGEDRLAYLARLDAHWRGTPALLQTLATQLDATMRDEAWLRQLDGDLPIDTGRLIQDFVQSRRGPVPTHIQAYELLSANHVDAGSIVITGAGSVAPLAMFTPGYGWEGFADQAGLFRRVEQRARQRAAAGREQPGLADDAFAQVLHLDGFTSLRPITENPFDLMATRIRDVQSQRVKERWTGAAPPGDEILIEAMDLHRYVDINGMLLEREFRQAGAIERRRLADVPADIAAGWRDARDLYRAELVGALDAGAAQGLPRMETLPRFGHDALRTRLMTLGIEEDPAHIVVELAGVQAPSSGGDLIASIQDHSFTRVPLLSLACANVGFLDLRRARVMTTDGRSLHDTLPYARLRALIRDLDLGRRYHEALLRNLDHSEQGRLSRGVTTRLQQARMRFEAADARLSYYRPEEPRGLIFDREDRGHAWITSVLDAPAAEGRRKVGGHAIAVHQLTYKGVPLEDILIIGTTHARSSPRIVAYTPGAPDGLAWREFSDRAEMAREFLYAPVFREYLLDRLPVEFTEMRGSLRYFRLSDSHRTAAWVLAQEQGLASQTSTDEPFAERIVQGDLFDALYDTTVSRLARDATALTRTTQEADIETTAQLVGLMGNTTSVVGDSVAGLASTTSQGLQAIWHAYDHLKERDLSAAFIASTQAYTAAIGMFSLRALRPASLSWPTFRATASGTGLIRAGTPLVAPTARLDARYRTGLTPAGHAPDHLGMYHLGGRRYLLQDGGLYEVRYDTALHGWRLTRPESLDTVFSGPAVERAGGTWRMHAGSGLQGGRPAPEATGQRWVARTDLLSLSPHQHEVFMETLWTRMSSHGEASRIYWDVTSSTGRAIRVTYRQWEIWEQALDIARQAPANRPAHRPPVLSAEAIAHGTRRILSPSEWPDTVWYYPVEPLPSYPGQRVMLMPQPEVTPSGLRGLRTSSQHPVFAQAHAAVPPRYGHVAIHLSRIRDDAGGHPRLRVIQERSGSQVNYVVQPATDHPAPVMVLRPGEFSLPAEITQR